MVAAERDRDRVPEEEVPDYEPDEPVPPGPIIGAEGGPEEAAAGGSEGATVGGPEEAAERRVERFRIEPGPGRPYPVVTTEGGESYTSQVVRKVLVTVEEDRAKREEIERKTRDRERAIEAAEGGKGKVKATGKVDTWLAENPNRRWRSDAAQQKRQEKKKRKGKGGGQKGEPESPWESWPGEPEPYQAPSEGIVLRSRSRSQRDGEWPVTPERGPVIEGLSGARRRRRITVDSRITKLAEARVRRGAAPETALGSNFRQRVAAAKEAVYRARARGSVAQSIAQRVFRADGLDEACSSCDERKVRQKTGLHRFAASFVARSKQKSRETAVQLVPRPEERPTDPPSGSARQITYNFPKRTLVNPTSAELQAAEEEYERSEERRRLRRKKIVQKEKAAEDLERLRKRKAETLKKPKETKDQKPGKAAKSAVKSVPESKTQDNKPKASKAAAPKAAQVESDSEYTYESYYTYETAEEEEERIVEDVATSFF